MTNREKSSCEQKEIRGAQGGEPGGSSVKRESEPASKKATLTRELIEEIESSLANSEAAFL